MAMVVRFGRAGKYDWRKVIFEFSSREKAVEYIKAMGLGADYRVMSWIGGSWKPIIGGWWYVRKRTPPKRGG